MHPHTSWLIFATHRTGSTLLCEALKKNTGHAGHPEEYFWKGYELLRRERWGTSTYSDYIAKALECTTTPNGVFGCKIMLAYFDDFINKTRQLPGYADLSIPILLSSIFPNPHFIWITRRDKVRQAVSLCKAAQTQIWEQHSEETATPLQELNFDFEEIENWLQHILRYETIWQRHVVEWGITPYTVVYEDFVSAYETTALDILRYLEVPFPADLDFGKRRMIKQADTISDEWVERYNQIKR